MQKKILNLSLLLTSLIAYFEWGNTTSHAFLFEAERDILGKLVINPWAVLHPFIMIPLAGQLILLFTLFQKVPKKILTYCGIAGIGIIVFFLFVVGIINLNWKITLASLPFVVLTIVTAMQYRTKKINITI
jgi:hypothetical protein